ncbi:MAG: serine hydrolase [Neisseriaceae bacterium]
MRKLLITLLLCSLIGSALANNQTQYKKNHKAIHKKHIKKGKHTPKTTHNKHKKSHKTHRHTKVDTSTSAQETAYLPNQQKLTQKKSIQNNHLQDFVDKKSVSGQPRLNSFSAIALNANTGEIIISKNPNAKLPIASITKLMTAMVVLDSGVNLNDYVAISNADIDTLRNTYSRLKVGMQFRRKDLLLLALMSSENRAAHALGRTTFKGGTSTFIRKMNEKAQDIGMSNTQFYDSTGLTSQNKSTALDLSKMVKTAYAYDEIKKFSTTKNADVMFGPRYVHRYINSDSLVRGNTFPIQLSKTGFINEAGHCLALYSIVDNKPIVMVFLNSTGKNGRVIDAITIKKYVQRG